jgi:hypothetical protein
MDGWIDGWIDWCSGQKRRRDDDAGEEEKRKRKRKDRRKASELAAPYVLGLLSLCSPLRPLCLLQLFWRLHQTVKNFVLKLRHEYQQRHGRPRTIVYMLPTATLRDVIETMNEHGVHRVYICDSHHSKTPVGVISIQVKKNTQTQKCASTQHRERRGETGSSRRREGER